MSKSLQQNIPSERIIGRIFLIRGKKVMFDRDLAELYNVETRSLNQAVRRNKGRFPADFMFQLNDQEMKNWISQIVTTKYDSRFKEVFEVIKRLIKQEEKPKTPMGFRVD